MTFDELLTMFPPRERLTHPDASRWLYARAAELGEEALCVEVGAWCGWTACVMAAAGPKVLCVDTFHASDRWVLMDRALERVGRGRNGTLDCFAVNVAATGMGRRVVSVQAESWRAASAMGYESADLVFLDADHTREAVTGDVLLWHRVVRCGGLLCGDNYGIPDVQAGVCAALASLGWEPPVEESRQIWQVRKPA